MIEPPVTYSQPTATAAREVIKAYEALERAAAPFRHTREKQYNAAKHQFQKTASQDVIDAMPDNGGSGGGEYSDLEPFLRDVIAREALMMSKDATIDYLALPPEKTRAPHQR